ncbi:hypothetical protein ACFQY8_00540 [Alloscardovia venturai]|uniref:Uncharacterized protein n=1 Tax=Alloscardovia venturai TaxID=1769421 RepID=A0ABW2Y4I8_9BIFI
MTQTAGFNLSQANADTINARIKDIEGNGADVSFVVVDMTTGNALGYDPHAPHYGASAIKSCRAC